MFGIEHVSFFFFTLQWTIKLFIIHYPCINRSLPGKGAVRRDTSPGGSLSSGLSGLSKNQLRLLGLSKIQLKMMEMEDATFYQGRDRTHITTERVETALMALLTAQVGLTHTNTHTHRLMVSLSVPFRVFLRLEPPRPAQWTVQSVVLSSAGWGVCVPAWPGCPGVHSTATGQTVCWAAPASNARLPNRPQQQIITRTRCFLFTVSLNPG